MRVQFQTEGGIAHFPGLSKPVLIDTDQLPEAEASELERLVESANFFELPATPAAAQGSRDAMQYTISIAASGHSHTVQVADPLEDPAVRQLVRHLGAKARELRR